MKKNVFRIVGIIAFIFLIYYIAGQIPERKSVEKIDNPEFIVNSLENSINSFLGDLASDTIRLSEFDSLWNYLDEGGGIDDVYSDFLALGQESLEYFQIRYIDEEGFEKVRINYVEDEFIEIRGDLLEDKSSRYYFIETMKLNKGEVYVSQLDLNIEEGVLENMGTIENPEYIPVIRYATPVFESVGERRGVVILNVRANYFLNSVRKLIDEGDEIYLINQDGFYLVNADVSREYGFMFDNNVTFFDDFFDESILLSGVREGFVEYGGRKFFLEIIRPDYLANEAYAGSQHFERDRYWILIFAV